MKPQFIIWYTTLLLISCSSETTGPIPPSVSSYDTSKTRMVRDYCKERGEEWCKPNSAFSAKHESSDQVREFIGDSGERLRIDEAKQQAEDDAAFKLTEFVAGVAERKLEERIYDGRATNQLESDRIKQELRVLVSNAPISGLVTVKYGIQEIYYPNEQQPRYLVSARRLILQDTINENWRAFASRQLKAMQDAQASERNTARLKELKEFEKFFQHELKSELLK